jgi:hypothetical protein
LVWIFYNGVCKYFKLLNPQNGLDIASCWTEPLSTIMIICDGVPLQIVNLQLNVTSQPPV